MGKLMLFFRAFRKGAELSNAAVWKDAQQAGNAVAGLLAILLAIATAFGYPLAMDEVTLLAVAGGIGHFGNWVLTVVTSKKVGLPAVAGGGGGGGDQPRRDGDATPRAGGVEYLGG